MTPKEKVLAALRSGRYLQGRLVLKQKTSVPGELLCRLRPDRIVSAKNVAG